MIYLSSCRIMKTASHVKWQSSCRSAMLLCYVKSQFDVQVVTWRSRGTSPSHRRGRQDPAHAPLGNRSSPAQESSLVQSGSWQMMLIPVCMIGCIQSPRRSLAAHKSRPRLRLWSALVPCHTRPEESSWGLIITSNDPAVLLLPAHQQPANMALLFERVAVAIGVRQCNSQHDALLGCTSFNSAVAASNYVMDDHSIMMIVWSLQVWA